MKDCVFENNDASAGAHDILVGILEGNHSPDSDAISDSYTLTDQSDRVVLAQLVEMEIESDYAMFNITNTTTHDDWLPLSSGRVTEGQAEEDDDSSTTYLYVIIALLSVFMIVLIAFLIFTCVQCCSARHTADSGKPSEETSLVH